MHLSINVPSLAKETALATDEPLPVKATFNTVLPTVKVVTSTSADKCGGATNIT